MIRRTWRALVITCLAESRRGHVAPLDLSPLDTIVALIPKGGV